MEEIRKLFLIKSVIEDSINSKNKIEVNETTNPNSTILGDENLVESKENNSIIIHNQSNSFPLKEKSIKENELSIGTQLNDSYINESIKQKNEVSSNFSQIEKDLNINDSRIISKLEKVNNLLNDYEALRIKKIKIESREKIKLIYSNAIEKFKEIIRSLQFEGNKLDIYLYIDIESVRIRKELLLSQEEIKNATIIANNKTLKDIGFTIENQSFERNDSLHGQFFNNIIDSLRNLNLNEDQENKLKENISNEENRIIEEFRRKNNTLIQKIFQISNETINLIHNLKLIAIDEILKKEELGLINNKTSDTYISEINSTLQQINSSHTIDEQNNMTISSNLTQTTKSFNDNINNTSNPDKQKTYSLNETSKILIIDDSSNIFSNKFISAIKTLLYISLILSIVFLIIIFLNYNQKKLFNPKKYDDKPKEEYSKRGEITYDPLL